ncbi:MAG: hypothetical protein AAF821_08830 [Cyanobacteria bacterium P01_D01_bin.156]
MSTLLLANAPNCPLAIEPEAETTPQWHAVCHINYTRDTWVNLLQLPSRFAYEKAKLLCQASNHSWAAWVPNHGEVILDRSHFYC